MTVGPERPDGQRHRRYCPYSSGMGLRTGLVGHAKLVVTAADTAASLGSGEVDVLGTPRVLALAEQATMSALAGILEVTDTTVGSRVELIHRAPSPVGSTVTAAAELVSVDGRQLTFDVTVSDEQRTVATASIVRVIVDRRRFSTPKEQP